ncbi:MAG: hypothetical protein JO232_15815 [Verrucomicrobia bacterium]|nr:hypothetical protein [Verrucomicrobiota bacterium]
MSCTNENESTDGAARKAPEPLPAVASESVVDSGALSEQFVILRPEDIHPDTGGGLILNWLDTHKGEVSVQLRDLDGFGAGRVTIKASTLQRVCPDLLPAPLESDHLFQVSLKTVVLQVQGCLRRNPEEGFDRGPADFDTPIAQVAREDEGYFKLQKREERKETATNRTIPPPANHPILTPADRPSSRISPRPNHAEPNESTISAHSRRSGESPTTPWCAEVASGASQASGVDGYTTESRKRLGQEMLREIFMTEDFLDVKRVTDMIADLPKVNHAVVLTRGTILAGELPEGYHMDAAILAPALMQTVCEFERRLRSTTRSSALTLMGEEPLSIFTEGNIHIVIAFEGRGLLPGVGKRIKEIARALDAIHSE